MIFNLGLVLVLNIIQFRCVYSKYEFDPNGYVIFCLCMGRFGNQADHFLGSMSFALNLNRTFVVPPFLTYKNIPYSEWFKLEKLSEFHRSLSAEDFMKYIAPKYWPKGKRNGFCWRSGTMRIKEPDCNMKEGNPMGMFWSELGVDKFDGSNHFDFDFSDYESWMKHFPADKFPVIALKGAPASYPIKSIHRDNQKYMIWSDKINDQVDDFIKRTFNGQKFIGIHLRNGEDWANACQGSEGQPAYMSSPQCLENTNRKIHYDLCFPSKQTVLKDLEKILVNKYNKTITNIYIATDKNPMIDDIKSHFSNIIDNLKLIHHDPWLPVIDLAILSRSEHFIGNCVSSFTSFVKRDRDLHKKPSSFWSFINKN